MICLSALGAGRILLLVLYMSNFDMDEIKLWAHFSGHLEDEACQL